MTDDHFSTHLSKQLEYHRNCVGLGLVCKELFFQLIEYVINFFLDSQEECWLDSETTSISKMKKTGYGYKIGEEEYVLQVECTCCDYSRFYEIEDLQEAAKCFITRCLECSFKRHVKVVPCDKKRRRSS